MVLVVGWDGRDVVALVGVELRALTSTSKNLRRGLLIAGMAVLAGIVVRAKGRPAVPPPASGGWRELEGPELR